MAMTMILTVYQVPAELNFDTSPPSNVQQIATQPAVQPVVQPAVQPVLEVIQIPVFVTPVVVPTEAAPAGRFSDCLGPLSLIGSV